MAEPCCAFEPSDCMSRLSHPHTCLLAEVVAAWNAKIIRHVISVGSRPAPLGLGISSFGEGIDCSCAASSIPVNDIVPIEGGYFPAISVVIPRFIIIYFKLGVVSNEEV